jgi:hypothetical protein
MKRGFPLILSIALGACTGRPLATFGAAASVSPAPDVYACIRKQIKDVGFTQESYDENELRVTARKYNEQVRRPDVQFRRLIDRIAFDVNTAGGDSVTAVSAQASTFAELVTHRGPTEQQERTSETAKDAARMVLGRCASSASKTTS